MDKAKAFLERVGKSTALKVVPLALAAVSAQGAAIFNAVSTTCVPGGGTNTLSTQSLPEGNGVAGVQMNGVCSSLPLGSGLGYNAVSAGMDGNFIGTDSALPGSLPVSFDFIISAGQNPVESFSWQVRVYIEGVEDFLDSGILGTSNPAPVAGSGFADTSLFNTPLGAGNNWVAFVNADCMGCWDDLVLDLGNSSLRINPAGGPVIPEPSTLSLFGAGAALLWLKRRKARA